MATKQELGKREAAPGKDQHKASSLLDMMFRGSLADLDDIPEPTAADLADIDALEAETPLMPEAEASPALALLAAFEEPELVSLESLDQPTELDAADTLDALGEDEMDEEDDDLVDDLLENYADIELHDDELSDDGYDLDDDDIENYQDLYGEDGIIIPSFREGELDDDDESDLAAYDGLR